MNTIKITVSPDTYLNQIPEFENGIPTDSFINKGRCGIGGTTLEVKQERHSIIIVPTVAPIEGKLNITEGMDCIVQNGLFPLFGGKKTKLQLLKDYLESDIVSDSGFKKIFVTPDSFESIIKAANELGKLQWIYDNFFLLFDEAHAIITECYRKKIRNPLRYFWKFKCKAMISATPFYFSGPEFQKLQKYTIDFTEKLGDIFLVNTTKTKSAVEFILTHPDGYTGNVHIFFNTVKQLAELLRIVLIENPEFDCNIFCSKSDENYKKLDKLNHFFNDNPSSAEYKKFNFYTTKYFEAWDLHDSNSPIIILVTDFNAPNTKVGIQNKGVQAIGRFRIVNKVKPHKIIHITNTRSTYEWKDFPEIYAQINSDADSTILAYNENFKKSMENNLTPSKDIKLIAVKYAEFNPNTINIELKKDSILVDQWANLEYSNQIYNNIEFVKKAWENAHYNVEINVILDDLLESIWPKLTAEKIRVLCMNLDLLEENKNNCVFHDEYKLALDELNNFEHFELAFKAYHKLGIETLKEIKFNKKTILEKLYKLLEEEIRIKISQDLPNYFELNKKYDRAFVKTQLQELYDLHKYSNEKGKICVAKATDIEKFCDAKVGDRTVEILRFNI